MSAKATVKSFNDKLRKVEMATDNPNRPLVSIIDYSKMTPEEIRGHESTSDADRIIDLTGNTGRYAGQ